MLLAFIHTEKTGGTTLNQVLRRNFFLRFADVRPVVERDGTLRTRPTDFARSTACA